MKRKNIFYIILFLLFPYISLAQDQTALLFLDTYDEYLTNDEGMSIAHQLIAALEQQAAPIIVSQLLWNHILDRKKRFEKRVKNKKSIEHELFRLYQTTNNEISALGGNASLLNNHLNQSWYQEKFPILKLASKDDIVEKSFDLFCYLFHVDEESWDIYRLDGAFLLFVTNEMKSVFSVEKMKTLSKKNVYKIIENLKIIPLHEVLQNCLKKDRSIEWSFYLTGHGYHKDEQKQRKEPILAGLELQQFRELLFFLDKDITTKLLLYNSCYSAGIHSILPYHYSGKDVRLNYTIIITSLTDAPTFTYGTPSGFKLPPYDYSNKLDKDNIDKDRGLQLYFMQNFHDFVLHAQNNLYTKEIVLSISPYQQCSYFSCSVAKIENLPLIRKKDAIVFLPLDRSQVYVLEQSSKNKIDIGSKIALLLYVKKYEGKIVLQQSLPFVSMVPGNQVHVIHELIAKKIGLSQLIKDCFFSIEDLFSKKIYVFDSIVCKINIPDIASPDQQKIENVLLIPCGEWLPSFVNSNQSDYYLYGEIKNHGYWCHIDKEGSVVKVILLSEKQKVIAQKFASYVKQEALFGAYHPAEELLSYNYYEGKSNYKNYLLQQCLQDEICKVS